MAPEERSIHAHAASLVANGDEPKLYIKKTNLRKIKNNIRISIRGRSNWISPATERLDPSKCYSCGSIINIVEVIMHEVDIDFSVGIASALFLIDNLYECPQCGCGLDCVTGQISKLRAKSFISSI